MNKKNKSQTKRTNKQLAQLTVLLSKVVIFGLFP